MPVYEANPVRAQAWKIDEVGEPRRDGSMVCWISSLPDKCFIATAEMLSRMTPKAGDYVVRQEDGYQYLNPKDVFERKYHLVPDANLHPFWQLAKKEPKSDIEMIVWFLVVKSTTAPGYRHMTTEQAYDAILSEAKDTYLFATTPPKADRL